MLVRTHFTWKYYPRSTSTSVVVGGMLLFLCILHNVLICSYFFSKTCIVSTLLPSSSASVCLKWETKNDIFGCSFCPPVGKFDKDNLWLVGFVRKC